MSFSDPAITCLILKRDGCTQPFDTRKLSANLQALSWGLDNEFLDIPSVVENLSLRLPSDTMGAPDFQLFVAEIVSTFSSHHPDYSILAGRVYTAYIHKKVVKRFSVWVRERDEASSVLFADVVLDAVSAHKDLIDSAIMHFRDFDFTYHALRSLERTYLHRDGLHVSERVQFLYMRVAIGIHGLDIANVLDTYDKLSARKVSFASPILWSGGLYNRSIASCYIFDPAIGGSKKAIDNVVGLSTLWTSGGGVGVHAGNIPPTSPGQEGENPGLMPILKVYDSLATYWSMASPRRAASATVYLPIWHCDVRNLILCRTNRASSEYRFRHLFPALWVPDVFMRRLEAGETWSLFNPDDVRTLPNLTGDAFSDAYEAYEKDGLATSTISARTLWSVIAGAQRESGAPFYVFADRVNERNNQKHLGVIRASNLCTEIVQYSSPMETAVCILGAVCLPQFLGPDGRFDFDDLHRVTRTLVRDLDLLIENAHYPTTDSAVSGYATRPLGIGVQGLADLYATMGYPFTSSEAKALNVQIFETVYHAALDSSCELAERLGPYDRWIGSPASDGVLQVDMWGVEPSNRFDFAALRDRIGRFGLRNSVLTAQMPTASTAHLLGSSEGVEPYTSNVVQHRVLSGNYNECSKKLVQTLRARGLWSERIRNEILSARGSVQGLEGVPDDIKATFRTAFELDPRDLIDMAVDRGPFVDQSQSLSLFVAQPSTSQLTDLALYAWKGGLKTGAYYIRTKPPVEPQPFGVSFRTLTSPRGSHLPSGPLPEFLDSGCPCDV